MQTATEGESVSSARRWLRGLWEYYRSYTHTAIHTAATAALTGFGLLVFVDPLFVALAIAAYVCPPLLLYSLGVDVGGGSDQAGDTTDRAESQAVSDSRSDTDSDTDSDGDDGDTDSDGDDGDSDGADADGSDADTDTDG